MPALLCTCALNSKEPILRSAFFGLTGSEGTTAKTLKELYLLSRFHADAFLHEALYKYPQAEYPYATAGEENGPRGLGRRSSSDRYRRL